MSTMLTRGAARNTFPKVQYTSTQLGGGQTAQGVSFPGGLDLTTPTLRLQPGALRDAQNFECATFGGYSRIDGYERFDGRLAPHEATYTIVQLAVNIGDPFVLDASLLDGLDVLDGGFLNLPAVGALVTQEVSGAVGVIIAVVTAPTPYIVVTMVVGVFDDSHVLYTLDTGFSNNAGVLGFVSVGGAVGWPTSSIGLPAGDVWNDGFTVAVVPGVVPNPAASPVMFGTITAPQLLAMGGGDLPLSSAGLVSGQFWNNGGLVCIA